MVSHPGHPVLPSGPAGAGKAAAAGTAQDGRWDELLHDWRLRSEHDGGYRLLRCRVCSTEVVR